MLKSIHQCYNIMLKRMIANNKKRIPYSQAMGLILNVFFSNDTRRLCICHAQEQDMGINTSSFDEINAIKLTT